MALAMPPTTKALANKVVVFLTTPPAAASGIPTLVELNAGLFAACHLFGDFGATPTQNTGEGPSKLCQDTAPTELGRVVWPAIEAQYSYMPQRLGTPGAAGNELYEAAEPGSQLTAVVLDGIDGKSSAITANAVGDVFLVEAGVRAKGRTGEGEFDKKAVTQQFIVVGGSPVAEDHKFAA